MTALFAVDRPDIVFGAICDVLCDVFPTMSRDLLLFSERGTASCAWVRQLGMFLMNGRFGVGQKVTARYFGRDRTTVLHAQRLVEQALGQSKTTSDFIDFLEANVLLRLEDLAQQEAEYGNLPHA